MNIPVEPGDFESSKSGHICGHISVKLTVPNGHLRASTTVTVSRHFDQSIECFCSDFSRFVVGDVAGFRLARLT